MALEWQVAPLDWAVGPDGSLRIVAGPRTDLFARSRGRGGAPSARRGSSARVEGDFQLSARVRADLQATFDAGALVLHADDHTWVKLALERSPQGEAMIVSVVTRGLSDDANGRVVTGDGVWLRVARIGGACALHASDDGARWELVRHFALRCAARRIWPPASWPSRPPATAARRRSTTLRFVAEPPAELRDGS